jgi:hypothetical protein
MRVLDLVFIVLLGRVTHLDADEFVELQRWSGMMPALLGLS